MKLPRNPIARALLIAVALFTLAGIGYRTIRHNDASGHAFDALVFDQ